MSGDSAEHVVTPDEVDPSLIALPVEATVDSGIPAAEAPRADGQEDRGRRRRRRRGRGGRSEGGSNEGAPDGNSIEAGSNGVFDMETADEVDGTEPPHPVDTEQQVEPAALFSAVEQQAPLASASFNQAPSQHEPLVVAAEPVVVTNFTAVRLPPVVTAPTIISLPVVQPAPLPIDELQPVLESAGLTLVQTAADKYSDTQAKLASAAVPSVRVRRERPILPPLQDAPLEQVETGRSGEDRPAA